MKPAILHSVVFCIAITAAVGAAQEPPRRSVTLPLADYLALIEQVQSTEEALRVAESRREPSVFELTSQEASMVWLEADADVGFVDVTSSFDVLFQGERFEPVLLPVTGLAAAAEIEPSTAASVLTTERGLLLTASEPGRYRVRVRSRARIEESRGMRFLEVAPLLAPVGELELDLPASLRWTAPGAVISRDDVREGRRLVGFTLPRGKGTILEVRRDVDGDEGEKTLADTAIATVIELGVDGVLRHDVVSYHVSRGALRRLVLTLPAGIASKRLVTDEGEAPLRLVGRDLTIERRELLEGDGHVVLTSQPNGLAAIPLGSVETELPVRERFLVLSSSIAADVEPMPSESFLRVDVGDVPVAIRDALTVPAHAAWRVRKSSERAALVVARKPPPETFPTVIRERRSLSLLTPEGKLVHRDTLSIQTSATTFELTLPAGARLWSTRVDGTWVRAVERDRRVLVPLGFGADGDGVEVVELVSVSELAVPERKSQLGLDLGELAHPVLKHDWKLLLPERNEYRYRAGALRPVRVQPRLETESEHRSPGSTRLGPGGLSGMRVRIYDDYGLVLPGTTVTLRSLDTGREMTAVTNEEGLVWFPSLPSGNYGLVAELAGFQPAIYESFFLDPGVTPAYRLTMHIGGIEETITVTGETPLIDTRSAGITSTFSAGRSGGRSGPGTTRGSGRSRPQESKLTDDEQLAFRGEIEGLRAGLTSGVKPVPVQIPETGKLVMLSGALPPSRVTVTLDVRPH